MRGEHDAAGFVRECQYIAHGAVRRMRHVDRDAERMRAAHQDFAGFGQTVGERVLVAGRAGERVVLGVDQPDDADAARHPRVERLGGVGERPRAFERQPSTQARGVAVAATG